MLVLLANHEGGAMAWTLQGTYFENCSCDMVCPCTTSGLTRPADQERCRVVLAFHVDRGEVDGLDVGDRTVVVVADTPQVMAEGNWRLGVVMDAKASAEQASALGAVFGGQAGGPMAGLAPLVGEMMGMETAAIEYVDDGRRHSLHVGDLIDIEIEDFVAPQLLPDGDVEMLTGMFHPANSTLTVASATRSRVSVFGLDFANEGKNGHSAPFSWSA
ncbi:hypothetical protein FB382_000298 [Nocardioides ginsengisegetis]|uniref:VldV n=2 Tax=Nocardioides TaxID=1839 RepID=A0A7W3IWK8_9ACTN|nr:DUF1326 domain-containing protein [Nocardioides ginsengisegetis]MBA8802007.1 hypothetical protein [Nocardioides ginsengisegetis]